MTGTLLAHYRLESRLGGGWLGDVYQAWDTLHERRVALRILSADLAADRDRMYRFLGQLREASAIQHPNIAQIYEIGEHDGTHFIAVEYVEGQPLETGTMRIDGFLDVARQLVAALEVMHARHMAHRGIRPSNILRTPSGQVKLLDFGMMKGGRGRRQSAVKETLEHSDRGLPYMSPEQVLERRHEIGRRSDIYSLGVVFYELLSGQVPFRGSTVEDTVDLVLRSTAPPLSGARPDVPPGLDRIVHKCLEKDRDLRYHSVRELLFDLKRFEDDPTSAKTARTDRRSRFPVRALLLLVILIAAAGAGAFLLFKKHPPESIAVAPFACEETADVAPFCEGLRADLERRLGSLPDVRVVSPPGFIHPRLAADAQKAGREAGAAAVLMAEIVNRREDMQVQVQLVGVKDGSAIWSRAYSRRFRDLLALSETMATELATDLGISDLARLGVAKQYTASPDAFLAYVRGVYWADRGTPAQVADGVQYLRLAVERDGRFALAWARLAELYIAQADLDAAPPAELGPKARQAAQLAMEADPSLPEAWSASAQVLYRFDLRLGIAEEYFRKAFALKPSLASPHLRAAELMTARGVGEETGAQLKQALELGRSMFRVNLDAGRVLLMSHRLDESLEQFRQALELRKGDPMARLWMALAYSAKGDFSRAVSEMEGVSAAVDEPPLARSMRAWIYAWAGRQADAARILATLEQMSRVRYVSPMRFAEIYAGMGNRAKALDELDKALDAGCVYLAFVPRWPMLDSVQQDRRFQEVLRRAGFGPTAAGVPYRQ